jgi:hypothetical protein
MEMDANASNCNLGAFLFMTANDNILTKGNEDGMARWAANFDDCACLPLFVLFVTFC